MKKRQPTDATAFDFEDTNRLARFVRQAQRLPHDGEPAWNWHLDCVCDHLEAVVTGACDGLLINIPPTHR